MTKRERARDWAGRFRKAARRARETPPPPDVHPYLWLAHAEAAESMAETLEEEANKEMTEEEHAEIGMRVANSMNEILLVTAQDDPIAHLRALAYLLYDAAYRIEGPKKPEEILEFGERGIVLGDRIADALEFLKEESVSLMIGALGAVLMTTSELMEVVEEATDP